MSMYPSPGDPGQSRHGHGGQPSYGYEPRPGHGYGGQHSGHAAPIAPAAPAAYSPSHGPSGGAGPSARPASVMVAAGSALGVALLNIVSAIAILTSVTDMTKDQIASGESASAEVVDMNSERATGLVAIFQSLAGSMIFWAVVLGVLATFALRAGRATRVLSTIILVITAGLKALDFVFYEPTLVSIVDLLVVLLAPVAIVFFFLPASNAYGKLRRAKGVTPPPPPLAPGQGQWREPARQGAGRY